MIMAFGPYRHEEHPHIHMARGDFRLFDTPFFHMNLTFCENLSRKSKIWPHFDFGLIEKMGVAVVAKPLLLACCCVSRTLVA